MLKCVAGISLNGEYTGWIKGKNKFRNNHVNMKTHAPPRI
jgi:hypothetical protein